MATKLGVLGFASFYGPAYAQRAAAQSHCRIEAATPAGATTAELQALSQPSPETFADTYDCEIYETVEEVLALDLDGVIVATNTQRRADDAVTALEADIPVLLAKPAAADAEGVREIADTANTTGTTVMMTTPARFDDAIQELGDRVKEDALGDVLRISASIRHDRVPAEGIEANPEHGPGAAGAAYAMSIYTADALVWLADASPDRAFAEYSNLNTPHSAHPDLGTATVYFADGSLGSMTMTYATDCREQLGNWEIEVVGSDGIVRTSHTGYEGIHWQAGSPSDRSQEAFGRSQSPILDRQFEAFVAALCSSDSPLRERAPSPDHLVDAFELCGAWERAAQSGSPVGLSPDS